MDSVSTNDEISTDGFAALESDGGGFDVYVENSARDVQLGGLSG